MSTETHARTLILGVGNILLRDEGIGVRVVEYLRTQDLPSDIELVDGGTAGADLIDILADRQVVLIIDAIDADAAPGTVLKLTPEQVIAFETNPLSLHSLDIPQTLAMTKILGCNPQKVILFGIVPRVIEPGFELSQELACLVPSIAATVLKAACSSINSSDY